MASKTLPVSFRLNPAYVDKLRSEARQQKRTSTGQLEYILDSWYGITGESRRRDLDQVKASK